MTERMIKQLFPRIETAASQPDEANPCFLAFFEGVVPSVSRPHQPVRRAGSSVPQLSGGDDRAQ